MKRRNIVGLALAVIGLGIGWWYMTALESDCIDFLPGTVGMTSGIAIWWAGVKVSHILDD